MPFPTIIGQKRVVKILDRIIHTNRFLPLIFVGQSGVGKRTLAIKLAQTVNCEKAGNTACEVCSTCRRIAQLTHPEVRIIFPILKPSDSSHPNDIMAEMIRYYPDFCLDKQHPTIPSNYIIPIGIIRWLASDMAKPPVSARKRFYIILHAHKMNAESQNALLKILEEPQQNTVFVLTSINQQSLFTTIRSRSQIIRFANLSKSEIIKFLTERKKNFHRPMDAEWDISLITALAQGSLGKALSIYTRPSDYIIKPLLDLINSTQTNSLLFPTLMELKDIDQSLLINNLILLLDNLLHYQFKSPSITTNETAFLYHKNIPLSLLLLKLNYFYERYHLTSLNINATLSNYTLISELSNLNAEK